MDASLLHRSGKEAPSRYIPHV